MPARRRFWRADALALAALLFLLGLATLEDYGITWAEEASYTAGVQNLAMIRAFFAGEELPAWFQHEIIGYQFVFDSLRALFATRVGALRTQAGTRVLVGKAKRARKAKRKTSSR